MKETEVATGGDETGSAHPTVRLFVGVWPPPDVRTVLSDHERPVLDDVRWTTERQWHVTLAFLGDVALDLVDEVAAALVAATTRAAAPDARLGPATRRVGRSVLCVPVDGLDELAARVHRALGAVLPGSRLDRPFAGHLTLARARGRRTVPASLTGAPLEARWQVREACLVRAELDPAGARYTTLVIATVPS
ncbi:MAG TPA: RNA 2',3'-cyclic phosphodiesterase [Acidimicrobiales bacterium]|nr:RNA 2',3'-cyclic phosphodiesterase [Acidimicrobiales bacterium]